MSEDDPWMTAFRRLSEQIKLLGNLIRQAEPGSDDPRLLEASRKMVKLAEALSAIDRGPSSEISD
jgi:hypothetical protein